MNEPSGRQSPEPFAIYDPDTSSWKTSALSLAMGNSLELSVTWPKQGMWGPGGAYELPTPAPPTAESDCSSSPLMPTPRTTDCHGPGKHGRGGLDLRTAISLLPTPTARDWKDGAKVEAVKENSILGRVAWRRAEMQSNGADTMTPSVVGSESLDDLHPPQLF